MKNICITYQSKESCQVYAEENQVHTVLRNLLSNAIKFTPEGGAIEIQSECDDRFITVSVSDTGVGMNEKTRQKIFDTKNYHSQKGTNYETGTGLGLKLCQDFVTNNGGKIWAESTEGKGSTFYFTLPLSNSQA